MSTGSPGPSESARSTGSRTRIMLVAWAGLILGISVFYQFVPHGTNQYQSSTSPTSAPNHEPPITQSPVSENWLPPPPDRIGVSRPALPSVPQPSRRPSPEEVAAAKMRWIEIKAKIEGILEDLDPALADTEAWATLIKQLPRNEVGKRIAGNKACVDQYRTILAQPRPPYRTASRHRDTLQVHLETAQKYLADSDNTTLPNASLIQDIDRLAAEVRTLAREYRRDRLALEQLVSETSAMPAAELTLEKAAELREKEEAGEYLKQLTAARAAAEAESQRKIREAEQKAITEKGKAEADRVQQLGDEEAKRLRQETEQRVAAIKEQAAKKQREEEAKRLRVLAEDPEVQRKYSAFLTKGFIKFDTGPGGSLNRGNRPLPASFGDLNSHGWLRDVESFAKGMSRQPNTDYPVFNDRPTHALPKTPSEWEEMEQLLQQFRLLGPIWVEMGLLEK